MKLVMIGGHTRNIGKTSVVEGIIRATADLNWTAVKVTQFGHGVCTGHCESCSCADNVDQFSITEEIDDISGSDTARFLSGGRATLIIGPYRAWTFRARMKVELSDREITQMES
jgi:hypothetical protein